jgi:hypothetical protein
MLRKLSDLFSQAAGSVRRDVLCSSFIFPHTYSLSDDEPAISIDVDTLDFDHILQQIKNEPEAIALCVCDDLSLILGVVKEVAEELCLDKFDSIQFYRGGLNVLRIRLNENKCGRSAYLEINNYRRRLMAVLQPHDRDWSFALLQIAFTALAVAGAVIVTRRM